MFSLKSVATVGGLTLASRALGFLREVLIARLLGTSPVAEAFSTWVTGSPVRPSSFIALKPSRVPGWM